MNIKGIAQQIAIALNSKRGTDIIILEIATKTSLADYMILASSGNERLLGALADEVEETCIQNNFVLNTIEGTKSSGWILLDCGDIIINLLTEEMREKYNIEKVWADCPEVSWE